MLTCENLRCEREDRLIFNGLGFCLNPGSLLIVKGSNGSGKTSLLKILAGLLPPSEGSVSWKHRPAHGSAEFLHQLTYIGHLNAVKTECTVEENIHFWASISGTETLVRAALKFFRLEDKRDLPCWQLSAGWQRKVALARLIVSPTPLWLLDEPTNYLDEESIALVSGMIESRVSQDGIVIVASHSFSSPFPGHTLMLEDYA